ncbi:Transmembrane 9 superfamily member 7 [Porphyridium purpureum]|uniref:Transmembrane 9 superfamily member n=1 Tax=Porphyridium purpureum TaxID=35688 RepID=A0A5J4Z940_PORPP|nr:Transmembrane 9 superfamily member 7 [Porphyridium purpureum]|eukprot:POR0758..scf295_1
MVQRRSERVAMRGASGVLQMLVLVLALALTWCGSSTRAFYIPGVAPVDYEPGAALEVMANKLTSPANHVAFDYHRFLFCKPLDQRTGAEKEGRVKNAKRLNFGQLLSGERAQPTRYEIAMLNPETCVNLCTVNVDTNKRKKALTRMITLIKEKYVVRLNMDNMPLVINMRAPGSESNFTFLGHPLGRVEKVMEQTKTYIYNHLSFRVLVHKPETSMVERLGGSFFRVVGFEVMPSSINHAMKDGKPSCDDARGGKELAESTTEITYTYDVVFEESDIKWATRWDSILSASPQTAKVKCPQTAKVKWFSLVNTIVTTLLISIIVFVVLFRTVYLDFARYNGISDEEELGEDMGWKMIHGDVFRLPLKFDVLAVLVGSGLQLMCLLGGTTVLAVLGFISPAARGSYLSVSLLFWVVSSFVCGFGSARLYQGMGGTLKRNVTLMSAFFLSGSIALVFLGLNFLLHFTSSTNAVPVFTLLLLAAIWFGFSIPLNMLGSYVGFQGSEFDLPCKTNSIPREVPVTPLPLTASLYALPGVIPFSVAFVPLTLVLQSMWSGAIFYMFGFLLVISALILVVSAQVGMIVAYLRFCAMNYHWWWLSFMSCASSAGFVFLYSVMYFFGLGNFGEHDFISTIIYFSYMALFSVCTGLVCGTASFLAALVFAIRIFKSIRLD